jgi:Fe-S-cluster containining protein
MIVPADCGTCGACCYSDSASYVPLSPGDLQRLQDASELLALTFVENSQTYMRMLEGMCVALQQDKGRKHCTIYSRRPEICREFAQASTECREALVAIRRRTTRPVA